MVVIDACGAGALPDAPDYGDAGTNTLAHLAEAEGGLRLPTLARLGLGSILPLAGVPPAREPHLHGRLHAQGAGKDSTAGHRELMGLVAAQPPPTYPDGFPAEVIELVERAGGRPVLCNRPCNGIEAIERFGAEHLATGALIVYTSQDSVLQIAAHSDVLSLEAMYEICARVRAQLPPRHAVGRVIARPFTGRPGQFMRSAARKDFALAPPAGSYLLEVQRAGLPVIGVGKTASLFAGVGFDEQRPGETNAGALKATSELIDELPAGLVFVNLVETDQVYGHRHDAAGFHRALREIDREVAGWLARLRTGDLLVLSADHGCDVTAPHTDHTREHVPLLATFSGHGSRRHDGPMADVGASVLRWLTGQDAPELPGRSFV